jgi:GNAT superfamily N-acetyltransferase
VTVELTARAALAADLPAAAALAAEGLDAARKQRGGDLWLAEQAPSALTAGHLEDLLHDPDGHLVLGCVDDVPVGLVVVDRRRLSDGRLMARIGFVFVHELARGIGVGELLVDAATAWARGAGCEGIDGWALPGDREIKNLFERSGLTARGIVVHRPLDGDGLG